MNITIEDHATDELREKIAQLTGRMRRAVLRAVGTELVNMSKKAFNDPSLRPSPWPSLKAGTLDSRNMKWSKGKWRKRRGRNRTAILKDSGTLWRSIRITALSSTAVELGSDRKYARIHQFGGTTPPRTIRPKNKKALSWPGAAHPVKSVKHPGSVIQARPFLPIGADGSLTTEGQRRVMSIVQAKLAALFP
jgi:phage gpG-like protein